MSYNIDTFEVLELTNLTIPADVCRKFDIEIEFGKPVMGTISLGEVDGIQGYFDEPLAVFTVEKITIYGEGSGWDFDKLLEILKTSKGTLAAFQIWEGGDSITMLTSQDGKVEKWDVDLAALLKEKYHKTIANK